MENDDFKLFNLLYDTIDTIKTKVDVVGINVHQKEIQLGEKEIKEYSKLLNIPLEKNTMDFKNELYDMEMSFIYNDIKFFAIK